MKPATRSALVAAATVLLAGCLDSNFTEVNVAAFTVDASTNTYAGTSTVDLSTSDEFQKHKGGIDGVSLDRVRLWLSSINPGNEARQLTSATMSLRADGAPTDGSQDVRVGVVVGLSLGDYLVASAGGGGKVFTLLIDNTQGVDKFLMDDVVKGSGKFSVVWSCQTDQAPTHVALQVELTTSMSYGLL